MKLTQKRLKDVFNYNPKTGLFSRRIKTHHSAKLGISGTKNGRGYLTIRLDSHRYYVHRLAFLYMTGKFPKKDIDHINNIKADNRWSNLRLATESQNAANSKRRFTNKSGFKGVSWSKKEKCWKARIQRNGFPIFLGYFDSVNEAHKVYADKARQLFGQFARTGE